MKMSNPSNSIDNGKMCFHPGNSNFTIYHLFSFRNLGVPTNEIVVYNYNSYHCSYIRNAYIDRNLRWK